MLTRSFYSSTVVAAALALAGVTDEAAGATWAGFAPAGDAYVSESSPTTNYGTSATFQLQSAPALIGYLRFDVQGLPGSITGATLRLKAMSNSSQAFDVRGVADNTWQEAAITFADAPPAAAAVTASSGPATSGTWVEVDVTPLVNGNGPVSFALTRTRTTPVTLASREIGATSAPQLVVTSTGAAPPFNASPPTVGGSPQAGRVLTAGTGVWSGSDPIGYSYQWRRCDPTGSACTDIPDATSSTYPIDSADVGATLRVEVRAGNSVGSSTASSHATLPVLASGAYPVIAAAGDIACDPASPDFNQGLGTPSTCRQAGTSGLLTGGGFAAVLALGDNQYECGGADAWVQSYDPSWGRIKSITRPVPGNHEYQVSGGTGCSAPNIDAPGYFGYFGPAAGEPGEGYYSFDLGAWHLIALNSNCAKVGGCGAGSRQEQWLRQDLAASDARCTLAYWHHPLFTSGAHRPGSAAVRPLFQALHDHHAEVVLVGHDHNYERFAPQTPAGALDLAGGVRQFIAGTGGKVLYTQGPPLVNSEARAQSFGVLQLTLRPASYDWRFVSESGMLFSDAGSQACDNPPSDVIRPEAPADLAATAAGGTDVDLGWTPASDNLGVTRYEIYRDDSLVASTSTALNSYTDTTAAPSTTYRYEVRARDGAGNLSFASNSATVTTLPPTALVFTPEADARVEEANPDRNYGTSYLRADGGSGLDVDSYLTFSVAGLSEPPQAAKLRVYAYSGTVDGPAVFGVADPWTEPVLTWTNRPGKTTAPIDDKGAITPNRWVEYDVTTLVGATGTYGFALATSSTDGVDFDSREAANKPRLVVVP